MNNEDFEGLSIESSKILGKPRKLKTRWIPDNQEDLELVITKPLRTNALYLYHHGYPNDQPTMGFFMWGEVDPDRVKKEYPDFMTLEEKEIILEYMSTATEKDCYMGRANSRMDGSMLGSCDMITPDDKWIFPEKWDTHYVDKYNICPPREFVEDAIKWKGTK